MRKGKSRSSKKAAQAVASSALKAAFIKRLREDKSIDWELRTLGQRSLILDVLYLLGISIDQQKNTWYSGFRKFLEEGGVTVDLKCTPHNEETSK